MADHRRDQDNDNDKLVDTDHQRSEKDDAMGGQPIGGNDSNTGSGTTLTPGTDFSTANADGAKAEKALIGSNDADRDGGPINDENEAEE